MTERLHSWSCKGCTNLCYRYINGEVSEYCRPMIEGTFRKEWITDNYIDCLSKITDPRATDQTIKIHEDVTTHSR